MRNIKDCSHHFAKTKTDSAMPYVCYSHKSLIRRQLGNVDMTLQENKATNLFLACKKIDGLVIKPNEEFSFWRLVGLPKEKDGYKRGLVISGGKTGEGIGGGLCQLTNLIHWMVLHSPLTITEHHHHDAIDLFPDFGRQVPFGVGTSVMYNYVDYRFYNGTDITFKLELHTDEKYLVGRLCCDKPMPFRRHIKTEDEYFSREEDGVYRNNTIYRQTIDIKSGNVIKSEIIKKNHAKILYDESYVSEKIISEHDKRPG